MVSSVNPGSENTWPHATEYPDPCLRFRCLRDELGALKDFEGVALNAAATQLLECLGGLLSGWKTVQGVPERGLLQALVEGGRPLSFELHGRLGAAERWFQARAVKNADGFTLWLFDFTEAQEEQRMLREALAYERHARAREAHLRLALETARMVTWEWSEARQSFHLSSNADSFFGHPPGGSGESMEQLLARVHPRERQDIDEAFARIRLSPGAPSFKFHSQWPDGSVHCYEVVGQSFHEEGQPMRVLGVAMDITERERADAALREAEERYRLVAQVTNDVLWDWNPSTQHIHWGESCFKVFGYRTEEMGDFPWWERQLHPEDRERVVRGLDDTLLAGGESWTTEYRFRAKDGVYVDVLDRGKVIRDERGRTLRMIGSMLDITERKRAEERMRQEAQFRERFIGILGHALRNPLNAILLSARDLRRRGLPATQQQTAHRIEASARRMGTMISDILDLTRARLSGAGIPLQLGSVHLPTVCRQVVEELTAVYPERLMALEIEGRCEGVWDTGRLAQVVSNLVGNALEHGAPEGPIFIRCRCDDTTQYLEVSNSGAPIPPHLLDTLFDPFRQGTVQKTGRGSGLGLGLFIVRELVRAHHGEVTVRSTQEEGTTFFVRLPRDSKHPGAGPDASPPEPN